MRDYYSHSELILAGLWGGVAGVIPNIEKEIQEYIDSPKAPRIGIHNQDQLFLRTKIWPSIREDVFQHDSVFNFEGSKDFSNLGTIHPNLYVGQNMGVFLSSKLKK